MFSYIQGLVDSATSKVRGDISNVASRLTSIWSVITGFFATVGRAETTLRTRVTAWVDAQVRHATAVATTLKWLAIVYVPRKIAQESAAIRQWAGGLIDDAEKIAATALADLRRWADDAVAGLRGDLGDLRSWATSLFAGVVTRLGKLEAIVFGVLSTPERIATYIGTAMVSWLMKYLMANIEPIIDYVYRNRAPLYQRSTTMLEDILEKIL